MGGLWAASTQATAFGATARERVVRLWLQGVQEDGDFFTTLDADGSGARRKPAVPATVPAPRSSAAPSPHPAAAAAAAAALALPLALATPIAAAPALKTAAAAAGAVDQEEAKAFITEMFKQFSKEEAASGKAKDEV